MKLPDENHLKDLQKNRIAKKLAAEFAGTFALVFAGTGAIAGSALCGSDIRRFNESGPLVGPGTRIRASRMCLDLPVSALNRRRSGGPSVSCCKSRRLLPNGAKREHL